jgi:hypothetical protein
MGVRDEIVAYCRRQIGCKYSYTPSGGVEGRSYNCSFLSTCAYRAAGLTIPGWQGHQNGDGSQSDWVYRSGHWTTDKSKLKPGDLVFFGTSRRNTGHVGIVSRSGSTPYIIDSTPSRGVAERLLPTGAGFVGGGWPMNIVPADSTEEGFPVNKTVTVQSDFLHVRDQPSTKTGKLVMSCGKEVRYAKGDKITIDAMIPGDDGYVWGHYIGGSSGKDRYVALGTMELAR